MTGSGLQRWEGERGHALGAVRSGGAQHHALALHPPHGGGLHVGHHAHARTHHLLHRVVLHEPAHHGARGALAHVDLLHVQSVRARVLLAGHDLRGA